MSTSNTNSNNDQAGRIKDDGRESRLTFRNFAEHQLRREFRELAMETCDAPIKAFAECGKEHGLMVVFKCREFQADVQGKRCWCFGEERCYGVPLRFLEYHGTPNLHPEGFSLSQLEFAHLFNLFTL